MSVRSKAEEAIEFFTRLWRLDSPDTEHDVARAESQLGVAIHPVLRSVYLGTGLRQSQQLHLQTLDGIDVDRGFLAFAREQQSCFFYALAVSDSDEDPMVYSGDEGAYEPEGLRLVAFLKLLWAINRPFEPPCADVALDDSLVAGWESIVSEGKTLALHEGALLIHDELAYMVDSDNLGARTNEALRELLEDNDELEYAAVHWEEGADRPV